MPRSLEMPRDGTHGKACHRTGWPRGSSTVLLVAAMTLAAQAAPKSIGDRVAQYGPEADRRLVPYFAAAGAPYPPSRITLIGLKQERELQLYAPATNGLPRFIRAYTILAASGTAGPKLREGDRQVPEGLYGIESLNPNSRFHLALRVNYPNADDRNRAAAERRTNLGGDIMIHGNAVSIGCIAVGDVAAEELFVLAARAGVGNIRVILSPLDFRTQPEVTPPAGAPAWVPALYAGIKAELARYPVPAGPPPGHRARGAP